MPGLRRRFPAHGRVLIASLAAAAAMFTVVPGLPAPVSRARARFELAGSRVALAAEKGTSKPRGKRQKKDEAEAEAEFEKVREQYEKEKKAELPIFERMPTVAKFGGAPCKKAVEFLAALYKSEENPGFRVAVTQALGAMGRVDAVKTMIEVGLPLLVASDLGKDMGLAELQQALSNRLEPEAEEWLVTGSLTPATRKDPAVLAVLLRAIAKLKTPHKVPVLLNEISKAPPKIQVVILEALRTTADPKVVAAASALAQSTDPEVQVAAYDVLAVAPSSKHRKLFLLGLQSPNWELRVLCLEALQKGGDKDVLKHATALLKDPDQRVQVAAVQILLGRGGAEVIEPLFRALEHAEGRVQDDIADALARLTGRNLGPVLAQWESWWLQNQDKGGAFTALSAEEFAVLKDEDKNQATLLAVPFYFGLRVLTKHVAFLIDCSESMEEEYVPKAPVKAEGTAKPGAAATGQTVVGGPAKPEAEAGGEGTAGSGAQAGTKPAGKETADKKAKVKKSKKKKATRMQIARQELLEVVKGLRDGTQLNLLRFNSLVTDFIAATAPAEKKELVKLEPKVRESANAFILESKGEGLTNLMAALKEAFQYQDLDTIFLLSDGAPTIGVVNQDEILSEVERWNRRRKIKINTISFNPQPDERRFLLKLSDQNYGVYVER